MTRQFQILKFKFQIQSGFTVIELILYMGLVTIFMAITSQVFVAILDTQNESEANSSIQQDGRYILARMQYDFNESTTITTPSGLGSANQTTTLSLNSGTTTYALSGSNLMLNSTYQLNSSETTVSNLTFTRLSSGVSNSKDTVQVTFTLTSRTIRAGKGRDTRTFQTTLALR